MRKAVPLIVLAAMLALAVPAAAKEGVSLNSTPDGLAPGQDWNVRITPIFHDPGSRPPSGPKGITITRQGDGQTLHFAAHRVSGGDYEATVRFPSSGNWNYKVTGFGPFGQEFNPVSIQKPATPAAGTPASSDHGGGFPLAALLGGLGALVLVAAGTLAIRRGRERPAAS